MSIADKLNELNENLGSINDEVVTQEDLIQQIQTKLNGNFVEIGSGGNVYCGTVITNEDGEAIMPKPNFATKYMIIWNIEKKDQWEWAEDDSLVRYVYTGIMLCAVKIDGEGWISLQLANESGTIYIAQNSATTAPYPPVKDNHPTMSVFEDEDTISWSLGRSGYGPNGSEFDFTNVSFNYVLVG